MGGKVSGQKRPACSNESTNRSVYATGHIASATSSTRTEPTVTYAGAGLEKTYGDPEFLKQQKLLLEYYNKNVPQKEGQYIHIQEQKLLAKQHQQKLLAEHQQKLREELHQQKLLEEQRQQKLREELHQKKLLEEQRQQKLLAEQHQRRKLQELHQQKLLEEQHQQKLREELHQKKLLEEQRQQKLREELHQKKILEEQRQQKLIGEQHQRRKLQEELHQQKLLEEHRQQKLIAEAYKQKLLEEQHKKKLLEEQHQKELLEEQHQKKLLEEQHQKKLLEEKQQKKLLAEEYQQKLLKEQNQQKLLEEKHQQNILEEKHLQKLLEQQKLLEVHQHKKLLKEEQQKSLEQKQQNDLKDYQKPWSEEQSQEDPSEIPKEWRQKKCMKEIMKLYNLAETQVKCLAPVSNRHLSHAVLRDHLAANWNSMPLNKTFMRIVIQEDTDEFRAVKNCFKATTQKRFEVVQIERVQNPFLLGCYILKKKEMISMYGARNVTEKILFRGTFASNIDKICENNFDWRRCADYRGNKYGKGISFSPISFFATYYSDKDASRKVMFLARVLASKITEGNEHMEIPPLLRKKAGNKNSSNVLRFDTTKRVDSKIIVKYSDSDFYPDYVIYYIVHPEPEKEEMSN